MNLVGDHLSFAFAKLEKASEKLLFAANPCLSPHSLDGIAKCTLERIGVKFSFDQTVLCSLLNCPQSDRLVFQATENNDRKVRGDGKHVGERGQSLAVGQPQIEQHDVDRVAGEVLTSGCQVFDAVDVVLGRFCGAEQLTKKARVVGIVYDQ